ncbi:Ribosomal RNA-processing protein 1 [Spathaspora sp. JA1]|nr:Ribosomal RNA-processing protein 1 [Spathaspora sp. JA1]
MSTSAFVKNLASNSRNTRDAALESLETYLSTTSAKLTLLDYEKLWKGLYFSVWFSDRPRTQERLCESLGRLYSEVIPLSRFPLFLDAFFNVIILTWPDIDQWRIDKFYLLIRRVVRHSFKRLKKENWDEKVVGEFVQVLEGAVLSGKKNVPVALPYHLCDIYLDELELVMFEELKSEQDEVDESKGEEGYAEKYEELLKKKLQAVDDIPVTTLISPFAKLNKSALLKTLREKCAEEVLNDERLKDWGVVEDEDDSEESEEEEEDDDEEEEEWKGF